MAIVTTVRAMRMQLTRLLQQLWCVRLRDALLECQALHLVRCQHCGRQRQQQLQPVCVGAAEVIPADAGWAGPQVDGKRIRPMALLGSTAFPACKIVASTRHWVQSTQRRPKLPNNAGSSYEQHVCGDLRPRHSKEQASTTDVARSILSTVGRPCGAAPGTDGCRCLSPELRVGRAESSAGS